MKIIKILISIMFLANVCFGDRVITDQLKREVVLPDEIKRVVVLQHQSLNLLNELNAMDKVVGVLQSWQKTLGKEYLRLAPSLANMPTPGDLNSINYEAVLALKPDVVIVTNYMPIENINKLQSLGIPVVAISFFRASKDESSKLNPTLQDDIYSYTNGFYDGVRLIADIVGKQENAEKLISYIENSQKLLASYTTKLDKKIPIYMANPNLTTYGSGKYTGILFARAGAKNVAAQDIKGYKQISAEALIKYNPEMIFVQNRYPQVPDELRANSALSNLKAIKDNQIFIMPEFAKAWGYPTAEAMAIGELWLAKKLYPNELKDVDIDNKIQEFYNKFYRTNYISK